MSPPACVDGPGAELHGKIVAQGNIVRDLKAKKGDQAEIDAAVKILLELKVRAGDNGIVLFFGSISSFL